MSRFLYRCLLRLHPSWFRRRYGAEMLAIFDLDPSKRSLLADAALSVLRQWALRSEPRQATAVPDPGGGPLFYTFENDRPRRAALVQGTILALAFFSVVTFAINRGGARHLRPLPLPWYSSSWRGWRPGNPQAEVATKSESLWSLLFSSAGSGSMPVIEVIDLLDDDRDGVLSASEIAAAPAALGKLDRNQDQRLSPDELAPLPAAAPQASVPPAKIPAARAPLAKPVPVQAAAPAPAAGVPILEFLRIDLVFAAIDTNHDGVISEEERVNAPAVLKRLDKNGDGRLTRDELLVALRR